MAKGMHLSTYSTQWSRFAKEYGAIQHEIALILVLCPSYDKAGWDTYYMSVVMKSVGNEGREKIGSTRKR